MIEPTIALQTAIRTALISTPAVTVLVPANQIRAGSSRPDKLPSIMMAGGQTMFLGHASGAQYVARASLDLHIWAIEDGADAAKAIGFAVSNVLKEAPDAAGFSFDEFSLPSIRWMRDPDPDLAYTHGVLTVECVMRWGL